MIFWDGLKVPTYDAAYVRMLSSVCSKYFVGKELAEEGVSAGSRQRPRGG